MSYWRRAKRPGLRPGGAPTGPTPAGRAAYAVRRCPLRPARAVPGSHPRTAPALRASRGSSEPPSQPSQCSATTAARLRLCARPSPSPSALPPVLRPGRFARLGAAVTACSCVISAKIFDGWFCAILRRLRFSPDVSRRFGAP